jgi:subtilisin family serine protease
MAKVQVQFGGRGGRVFDLETAEDLVAVRTEDGERVEDARLSGTARRMLDELEPVTRFRDAGVQVFHVRSGRQAIRDHARATLKAENAVRFAGRVLADPVFKPAIPLTALAPGAANAREPVLYSENLFVKFSTSASGAKARRQLAARGLKVKRAIEYLANAYFVEAREGIGLKVFDVALDLLRNNPDVELCHPELLRPRQFRRAFPPQWHLKKTKVGSVSIDAHAHVVEAWKAAKGKGITIAVIDSGIDIDHEEFASPGKIVAPRDATDEVIDPDDPRPQDLEEEHHGTACAGVACANGRKGASGVAPAARLMPIRLESGLGSQGEADAFAWAADNGADVISCSWGPIDGDWFDPEDPAHRAFVPLPDNTRLAIEHALSNGRGGKGCVICWAAGNGNESVDNDGYASHPGVIAVAACNDRGTRSVYSDTGKALWCAFPSDDSDLEAVDELPNPKPQGGVWNVDHPAPRTPGIWTTDLTGKPGYNPGGKRARGDKAGNYANDFGGTSSSTPGVAGVVALMLSVNKALRQEQVKDLLSRACDQIDRANGKYDPETGHSPLYGYGRLNAATAVKLARQPEAVARQRRSVAARDARESRTGAVTMVSGESRLDGTLLAMRPAADPIRAATQFLLARNLSGVTTIVGAPDTMGTTPVFVMVDAQPAARSASARPARAVRSRRTRRRRAQPARRRPR